MSWFAHPPPRGCNRRQEVMDQDPEFKKRVEEAQEKYRAEHPPTLFEKTDVELKPYDAPITKILEGLQDFKIFYEDSVKDLQFLDTKEEDE